MKYANFKRAHLNQCLLCGSNLENVDCTRALLVDVDFRGCNVENAIFEQTWMGPIHVHNIVGHPAIIEDYGAEDVDFSEAGDGSDIGQVDDESSIFAQTLSA